MPFVLNGSPLIFSPCFVFLLFFCFCFFFVAIADPSQCERETSFSGLLGLSSAYFEAS